MNSNDINPSCLTSFESINQMLFRCRSSIEKHFLSTKVSTSQRDIWGSGGLPPEKFSLPTCSRTSENALCVVGKGFLSLIKMGSIAPSSILQCTNMEDTKF